VFCGKQTTIIYSNAICTIFFAVRLGVTQKKVSCSILLYVAESMIGANFCQQHAMKMFCAAKNTIPINRIKPSFIKLITKEKNQTAYPF
jgi:hypothetical protein